MEALFFHHISYHSGTAPLIVDTTQTSIYYSALNRLNRFGKSTFLLWICQASDSRSRSLSGGYSCQRQSSWARHSLSPRRQRSHLALQADIGLLHFFGVMVGSGSLIKGQRCLVAGFPVYIALRLVISITPLLNVHPRTAALQERGGKGWFGQVSQESAGGDGSRLDGERGGTVWEQPHHAVQGQPPACLLSPSKPTICFPETSRLQARAHHALMQGLFWHRVPGSEHQPSWTGETTSELQLCCQLYQLALLAKNNFDSCYLNRAMPGPRQILMGPRLLSSAAFCPFMHFTLPACSSPQEKGAAGSAPCAQLQRGRVTLVPLSTVSHTKLNSDL